MRRLTHALLFLPLLATLHVSLFAEVGVADEVAGAEVAVTAEPETIELTSGDKITGVIVSRDDSGVVMDHPVFGRITIPAADIAPPVPDPEERGIFGTRFLRGARRDLGFGVSGASGNSENVGLSVTLAIEKTTEHHRGRFGAAFLYASERENQTQNQFFMRYVHDFLLPQSKFFLYLNGRFDYDEFRDWDERITGGGGAGYEIYKDDRVELDGRVGFGFSKNFGSATGVDYDWVPELQVGVEFDWIIIEGMTFHFGNAYFPDLQDIQEFRNITDVRWSIDIGIVRGLSFNVGVQNEYISDTLAPSEKNDLKYIGALAYQL